jgi:hypothetical protein
MAARRENAREGKGGSHFFAGNMQGITKLAIRQLARRGGGQRIPGMIYDENFFLPSAYQGDSYVCLSACVRACVRACLYIKWKGYPSNKKHNTWQCLDGFLESGDEATLSLARDRLERIKSNPTSSAAYGEMLELWRMTMDN